MFAHRDQTVLGLRAAKADRLQGVAHCERIAFNGRYRCGDINRFQSGAPAEGQDGDRGQATRQGHLLQIAAIHKHGGAQAGYGVRHGEFRQSGAAPEGVVTDVDKVFGQRNGFQTCAVIERAIDSGDTIWQRHGLQCGAAVEDAGNLCNRIGKGHIGQGGAMLEQGTF